MCSCRRCALDVLMITSSVTAVTQATPAMRLLDDCLDILGDVEDTPDFTGEAYNERRRAVAARMRDAFTGGELAC